MLRERKWNYIFNLFYAETNYQEEKRGFICILTVELVTSSEMELPPCCVPKESVVPALGSFLDEGTRNCAAARPLAAAVLDPQPFPLLYREERTSGGPSTSVRANWTLLKSWHNVQRDRDGTLTQLCFVMPWATQTLLLLHWCHAFRRAAWFSMGINLWGQKNKAQHFCKKVCELVWALYCRK